MQRMILWTLVLTGLLFMAFHAGATKVDLVKGFVQPPAEAKPMTFWFWMNGNISREGITKDLEEMKKVGLRGASIMEIGCGMPAGPVQIGTPQWREMMGHAIREADRLGLKITIHNGPGWCGSSGPWVKPEQSMQRVSWSEARVHGPQQFKGTLAQPYTRAGFYRDFAVFAFPAPEGDTATMREAAPKLSSQPEGTDLVAAVDGSFDTLAKLPAPAPGKPSTLTFEFAKPFTARALTLVPRPWQTWEGEFLVSDDGKNFRKVRELKTQMAVVQEAPNTLNFAPVSARWFRIVVNKLDGLNPTKLELAEMQLHGGLRIDGWEGLAGFHSAVVWQEPAAYTPASAVATRNVQDLTAKMKADGQFEWTVPAGDWIIVRMGYTPTGATPREAPTGMVGMECDRLSREGLQASWDGMMKQIVEAAGPLAGKSLESTHTDSWEVSTQNWTPRFREEFQKQRGYDLFPYLPALTGRVVENPDVTQRFYWDMRRNCADLLADNYYSGLHDLAAKHGLQLSTESYGDGPMDFLECAGRTDVPMAEFWADGEPAVGFMSKFGSSPAHTYGIKIAQAEAFTANPGPKTGRWLDHPYRLKAVGDSQGFCGGINRLVIHRFAHQPWPNVKPGMTMGQYGIHFESPITWWKQAPAWTGYLARCQYLLQQGLFVADALYFRGESVPGGLAARAGLSPTLPEGYDFDGCSADVILNRMKVKDGRIVLPDGMSYKYLVLCEGYAMTPKVAAKIRELAAAGATVVGQKPVRAPGLSGYPACDPEVQKIANEIWGACDGVKVKEASYQAGRVIWNKTFEEILAEDKLAPDFSYKLAEGAPKGTKVNYIHRTAEGAEIYFVANPQYTALDADVSFRVSGLQPELWHPDTGVIEPAALWNEEDGRVHIPLHLDPAGSVFVVFRPGKGQPHLMAWEPVKPDGKVAQADGWPTAEPKILDQGKPGKEACALTVWQAGAYRCTGENGKASEVEVKALPEPTQLAGPWDVSFPLESGPLGSGDTKVQVKKVAFERLVSWPERPEPEIRYFSGTATYEKELEFKADDLAPGKVVAIDLGRVEVMALLKVNGRDFGVLWKPPFRAEITRALRPGKNRLEIQVVNLWPNRLIGDEQLPEEGEWNGAVMKSWPEWLVKGQPSPGKRTTFTTIKHWSKYDKLLDSGLLGPVVLRVGQSVRVP